LSYDSPSDSWEDWFWPPAEPADADIERFKWGWNEADGETVWPVGGPGDGRPAHAEQLETEWGRAQLTVGDVVGGAEYQPARGSEPAAVAIHVYYGAQVPDAVVGWFRREFPEADVRLAGAE
jgi:hypothetical protein